MPVREGRDTSVSKMGVVNTHDEIEHMVPDMRKINKEVEKEILLSDLQEVVILINLKLNLWQNKLLLMFKQFQNIQLDLKVCQCIYQHNMISDNH